jgi:hypothetical protein
MRPVYEILRVHQHGEDEFESVLEAIEQPVERPVEQPEEQHEEQETLHLQDQIHLRITVTIIIIIIHGRVADNDAFRSYNMQSR